MSVEEAEGKMYKSRNLTLAGLASLILLATACGGQATPTPSAHVIESPTPFYSPTPEPETPTPTLEATLEPTVTATDTPTPVPPTPTSTPLPQDVPPVIVVQAPKEVLVGQQVVLDASGTFDYDGDPITFVWKQFHNPDKYTGTEYVTGNDTVLKSLDDALSATYPNSLSGDLPQIKFTPEWPGNYRIELVARDDDGESKKFVDVLVRLAQPLDWEFRGASAGVPTWGLNDTPTSSIQTAFQRMVQNGVEWYEFGTAWFMEEGYGDNSIMPVYDRSQFIPNYPPHILPTVSDERLIQVINLAHQSGLKVYLRPDLEVMAGDGWNWRGNIQPSNPDAWWESYRIFLKHYAEIARDTNVEMFSVGFEMNSMVRYTDQWNRTIAEIREIYPGLISYDCGGLLYHGKEEDYDAASTRNWEPPVCGDFVVNVDRLGVDWYPSLTNRSNASVSELRENVERITQNFLIPLYQRYGKPIYFGEIDYSSVDGNSTNPLSIRGDGPIDNVEQQYSYEAVLAEFSQKPYFVGLFPTGFYLTYSADRLGTTNSLWYKPAEDVFSIYY